MVMSNEIKAEYLIRKGKEVREVTDLIDSLHDKLYDITQDDAFKQLDVFETEFNDAELEDAIDDMRNAKKLAEEALTAVDQAYREMPEDSIFDDLAKKLQ